MASHTPRNTLARERVGPDWGATLFWLVAGAILVQAAASAATFIDGRVWDWGHFYYAAEALSQGENPFEAGERGYIYPVTFAWFLQPLTTLGFELSAAAWVVAMGSSLAAALWLTRRALMGSGVSPDVASMGAALGALFVSDKFVSTLKNAQTDGIILVACMAALVLIRRRPVAAGLLIAAAAALKYHALLFLILFLFRRRWVAAATAGFGFAALLCAPALTLGWQENLSYIQQAFSGLSRMVMDLPMIRSNAAPAEAAAIAPITWERSISATSAALRMAKALPGGFAIAGPLLLLTAAGLTAALAWRGYLRNGVRPLGPPRDPEAPRVQASDLCDWALILMVMVVLSPQSTARHFLYALLPLAMIAVTFLRAADPTTRRLFLGGAVVFVIALNMPLSEFPALMNAWRSISAASWTLMALLALLPAAFMRTVGGAPLGSSP